MDARCLLEDLEIQETEEIYIHFYTVVYPKHPDRLSIYWYKNTNEHVEIFEDIKRIFGKMKEFSILSAYTGDIFCIKNERLFMEQLLLLGVEQKEPCSLQLINGVIKHVHCGTTSSPSMFNDLFDICFQSYDMYHSFSSSDQEHPITVLDKKGGTVQDTGKKIDGEAEADAEAENEDKHLLILDFFGHRIITTFIKLRTVLYSIFHSIIDNQTLNKWFIRLVEKREYATAIKTIQTIETFHREQPYENKQVTTPSLYEDSSEEEKGEEVLVKQEDPKTWIQLFCNLYLQKDSDNDMLLSEVYQHYCTASAWSATSMVPMAQFMKTLRSLNRFSIRRRSKGMMMLGHRSLVLDQETIYKTVKKGQMYDRNLLNFVTPNEMKIKLLSSDQGLSSNTKFAREVTVLLPRLTIPLTPPVIHQFCSNPHLTKSLEIFAVYVEQMVSKPHHMDFASDLAEFREMSQSCILYYPFSKDILQQNEEGWSVQSAEEPIRAYNDPLVIYSNPMHDPMMEKEGTVEGIICVIDKYNHI